ncbi:hypothetical protein BP5796_10458 [Coleophoma crateriformis]|uniref:Cytochrome P450 n=1 Tax=Coleophoma crateriformis TaxID=565419 RepID=A0A3D8QQ58_9HELO|nr:hypothetical protein BP5796_10458 [Coleophoma crateriformis]
MIGLSVILQAAWLAVLVGGVYRRYFHPLSRYPGPFLASITNLWRFFDFFAGQHHLTEAGLHKKYGPVVRIGPNSLSFSSLADFDAIYGYNRNIEKGDFYSFGRQKASDASIFSARSDAAHKEHRKKVVGPALSTSKIITYHPVVKKNVANFLGKIARARGPGNEDGTVEISELVHAFTFDTTLEIVFGRTLSADAYTDTQPAKGLLSSFNKISKFSIGTALLPWLQWTMSHPKIQAAIRKPKFDSEGTMIGIGALVSKTRRAVTSEPGRQEASEDEQASILQNFLRIPKDDSRWMDPELMWRECFNLVFAAPGSTAAALTATLYELAAHQEWQERIYHESLMTEKEASDVSPPPLLTAVLKESMRLHVPFPSAFPRDITAGAESAIPSLSGHPLPLGTTVQANAFVLSHSADLWGDDVEEWRPERFLSDPNRQMNETPKTESPSAEEKFVVFSKGARGCVGKEIALMLLAEAVAAIIKQWRIEKRGGMKGRSFLEMQYQSCPIAFLTRS